MRTTQTKSRRPSQSPQARWSRKKKKQGKCSRCGEPRRKYAQLCDAHQEVFTEYMRAYRARRKKELGDDKNANPRTVQAGS